MAKACRFLDHPEREKAVRLHLTVPGFAFSRPETGKAKVGCPVVVSIVAARSSLGIDPFFSPLFDPDRGRMRFVIVDLVFAVVRPFAVAGTGSAAAAAVAAVAPVVVAPVAVAADLAWIADSAGSAGSAGSVCSSVEAMVKARDVAVVASCSLVLRFSSSHNRSCPSLLYFAVRA